MKTKGLNRIAGGKKLIYTQKRKPLTAIADFEKLGETDAFFAKLAHMTKANNGMWLAQSEKYMIEHARDI